MYNNFISSKYLPESGYTKRIFNRLWCFFSFLSRRKYSLYTSYILYSYAWTEGEKFMISCNDHEGLCTISPLGVFSASLHNPCCFSIFRRTWPLESKLYKILGRSVPVLTVKKITLIKYSSANGVRYLSFDQMSEFPPKWVILRPFAQIAGALTCFWWKWWKMTSE